MAIGHQPTPTLSDAALAADRQRNAQFLAPFLGGAKLESYAYPYGASSLRTKKFLAPLFTNLRGVHQGINEGRIDLAQLNAMPMEKRSFSQRDYCGAPSAAPCAIMAGSAFIPMMFRTTPSEYGATPAMLAEVLDRLAEARIDVLPMREAVAVALG